MLLRSLTYVWNYDFREWKASVGWFKPVRKFRLSKTKDMYQPAEGKPKVKVWGGNTVHMNGKVLMWASKWIKMVIWKKKKRPASMACEVNTCYMYQVVCI